ncbi:MAG: hypothetical protein HQK49_08965 [Oligoflexia bacterium]|nr:hypothetical protein [Oligoflexia bacterium]
MKYYLLSILILFIISGCGKSTNPNNSVPISTNNTSSSIPTSSNTVNATNNTSNTSSTSSTVSAITTLTSSSLPSEFSKCNIYPSNYSFSNSLIGYYNICLSSQSGANKIIIQVKNGVSDYKLCFFPTSTPSAGGSVMIGDVQCISQVSQNTLYQIQLSVNRSGFTDTTMNGVMIVKDSLYGEVTPYHTDINTNPTYTIAYQDCMVYLYNTGDATACQRFKDKGQYISVLFQ